MDVFSSYELMQEICQWYQFIFDMFQATVVKAWEIANH